MNSLPMKRLFAALVLSICSFSTFAQSPGDTITVQAFDWSMTALGNSGVRDMMVPFPDDPTLTYEKIIMKYNMRCRDGNVNTTGGNYVACGEWDYSCNTMITDSSKTDSIKSTHPNYLITGFSGTTFNYTSQPTYTYYQSTQQDVAYTTVPDVLQQNRGAVPYCRRSVI